ncbi:MAG TPA: ATP-binding protein [Acidimicrobiales bacterium]|jgi:anti-sigma regulatory factor (Ser/Thr protein kinase)
MALPEAEADGPGTDGDALVVAHLPAAPAFIRLARLLVSCFLETHLRVGEIRDHGIRLAVTEVFTAAVEAHGRAAVDAPLVLRLALHDGNACISLQDAAPHGNGGRPEVADPRVHGGLVLARALVDDAWVEPTPDGQVVHLLVHGAGR